MSFKSKKKHSNIPWGKHSKHIVVSSSKLLLLFFYISEDVLQGILNGLFQQTELDLK